MSPFQVWQTDPSFLPVSPWFSQTFALTLHILESTLSNSHFLVQSSTVIPTVSAKCFTFSWSDTCIPYLIHSSTALCCRLLLWRDDRFGALFFRLMLLYHLVKGSNEMKRSCWSSLYPLSSDFQFAASSRWLCRIDHSHQSILGPFKF